MAPKIYELPASSGVDNKSLVIEHAPDSPTAQRFNKQPAQQPQGSADPKRMLANQMDAELNNTTRWFDSQAGLLDQQQLEPDQYKKEYAKLQRQAMNQRVAIQAKHQAAAQQIKNMQKLVETGMLAPEQMQSTMLVMAGVPIEHVRRMFAQAQRQKPSTQLNEIKSIAAKVTAFRTQFDDHRKDYFGYKGVYYRDPTGKKRKATKEEVAAYDATTTQLAELDRAQQQIFSTLTPLEQASQVGSQAVQRFGMGRRPSLARQRFGGVQFEEPAPVAKKQLTKEAAIAILKEAGGDKEKARQVARDRGYKL